MGAEEKSEIAAIPNKYRDTLDDLIDSSDTELPDQPESLVWLGLIDKGTRNVSRSGGAPLSLLEKKKHCLNEDVLVILLELVAKTGDFQVYKYHDVAPLGCKSGRAQYEEGQKGGEDEKDKKDGENGKSERGGGRYRGNKVNPIVKESSGSEASVYYHIIYQCYQGLIVLG